MTSVCISNKHFINFHLIRYTISYSHTTSNSKDIYLEKSDKRNYLFLIIVYSVKAAALCVIFRLQHLCNAICMLPVRGLQPSIGSLLWWQSIKWFWVDFHLAILKFTSNNIYDAVNTSTLEFILTVSMCNEVIITLTKLQPISSQPLTLPIIYI